MSRWTLDNIPWQKFEPSRVEPNLLAVVKAAALVERNAGDYVIYLSNVFAGDPEFRGQIVRWGNEEVQHGMALGRWAQLADPDFDFEGAFQSFVEGYRLPLDSEQSVRGSRAGELIARCVVESGTSCFYSALRDGTTEPVLKTICHLIAGDEYRHYKLFYDSLQRYQEAARPPAWKRLQLAFGRCLEITDDELPFAYHCANNKGAPYDRKTATEQYFRRAARYYRRHHLRRAAGMMTKAAGFDAQGPLARAGGFLIWSYTRWKAQLPLAA